MTAGEGTSGTKARRDPAPPFDWSDLKLIWNSAMLIILFVSVIVVMAR